MVLDGHEIEAVEAYAEAIDVFGEGFGQGLPSQPVMTASVILA